MVKALSDIIESIMDRALFMLGDKNSVSVENEKSKAVNGDPIQYYVTISKKDKFSINIHELILTGKNTGHQSLLWNFSRINEREAWKFESGLINGKEPEDSLIERELYDLFIRLNWENSKQSVKVELPEVTQEYNRTFNPYIKRIYSYLYLLVGSALLVLGLFATLFVSNIQYNRMARIVNTLDKTISQTADGSDNVIDTLADQIDRISNEVSLLVETRKSEEEAFQFNRYNMVTSVRQQADGLSSLRQYSMKKAYYYLADRIEDSTSYGELYYHFSRLPDNNAQAETLLATDRDNIISLDQYEQNISYFVYPVRTDGEGNTGKGFMISSGYMDMRMNPLGEGGGKPHYAIDIININNIINITDDSVMNRASQSGAIVSSASGVILDSNYSSSYGWFMEIEHPLTEEVLRKYPGITRLTTFYAHMDKPYNWSIGDHVKADEKLGDIGNSGISTGPHLHYEIRIYNPSGSNHGYHGERFYGIEPLTRITS